MLPLRAFMFPKDATLARRIQWQVGIILALVIVVVTWLSYRNTAETLRLEAIENLRARVQANTTFESVDFLTAARNTQSLRDAYSTRLHALGGHDPQAEFETWFSRDADGAYRLRPERQGQMRLPSVFIRHSALLTPELRRRVVVAFELMREWGPALTLRYFSAYFDFPGTSLVLFSSTADGGKLAQARSISPDFAPDKVSNPTENPARQSRWTDVYFDDDAQTWMVTVSTPVDAPDWIAAASQDVALDGLMDRSDEQAAQGTFNVLLDAHGRLLSHPLHTVEIRRAGGSVAVAAMNDAALSGIAAVAMAQPVGLQAVVVPSPDGAYYLGVGRIRGPQWLWVTVYPKALVEGRSLAAARSILVVGLVGLVLELGLLAWVIRRNISVPLLALSHAAQALADGHHDVELNVEGQAELAQLVHNFKYMTDKLRQREAALKSSEAFKDALFQTIPDMVFVKDMQGRFVAANRAFTSSYAMTELEVIGKLDSDLVPEADARYYRERDLFALAAKGPSFSEHASTNVITGVVSYFETIKTPIYNIDGVCIGLLGVGRNITERLQAQQQLQALNAELEDRVVQRTGALEAANAEMAQAMAALQSTQRELVEGEKLASLGRMVAGIAHELNTPIGNALTIGSTMAQRAQLMAAAMADNRLKRSELSEFLQEMASGAEVLERALGQASHLISSFKQVAADQESEQRRGFDLATTVEEIAAILRPGLRGSGIRLESRVPADMAMDSYPGLVAQVLSNLVTNAKMHAFDDGQGGEVHIEALDLGSSVSLAVTDNGNGIPEAIRGRIFDPFFTTKMGRGGTGLGLSIVHGLVTQGLGGTIRVDYSRGRGTSFVVVIPKVDPRPARGAQLLSP